MANRINIFGDIRVCWNCSDPADVVEQRKDYCVECWTQLKNGKSIEELGKEVLDNNSLILNVVKP
tara:strand:- start:470 stop:664 length:195 start_codon:yes stop_codon:yes gene_type:complete